MAKHSATKPGAKDAVVKTLPMKETASRDLAVKAPPSKNGGARVGQGRDASLKDVVKHAVLKNAMAIATDAALKGVEVKGVEAEAVDVKDVQVEDVEVKESPEVEQHAFFKTCAENHGIRLHRIHVLSATKLGSFQSTLVFDCQCGQRWLLRVMQGDVVSVNTGILEELRRGREGQATAPPGFPGAPGAAVTQPVSPRRPRA
jgi:hypothetical protein